MANSRKTQIHQRKEDAEREHLKYKMFLQHRKDILQAIREAKTADAQKRYEMNVRGRRWLRIMHVSFVIAKAMNNFSLRRDQIRRYEWKIKACRKIRRNFTISLLRYGGTIATRQTRFIRQ